VSQLSFIPTPEIVQPQFKPLLAFTVNDLSQLTYPLYASIKLDGIRTIILNGTVFSRSMKPIRSKAVQQLFGKPEFNGLDSEVLYGEWNASDVFNQTTQAVMSFDLKPGFEHSKLKLAVFDYVDPELPYNTRLKMAKDISVDQSQMVLLSQFLIHSETELLEFEENVLVMGYEGVMVRSLNGRYKQGRSTAREGILGKIKRFTDAEATVIGFEERMHNTNEAVKNELGHSQRSQAKAGMVGTGTLGALKCACDGIEFSMGSGFDDSQRAEVWGNKNQYLGRIAKFKYQKIGMKDSYRMPIFLGWRDKDDMS
jgi:DNA ligase 1